MLAVMARFDIKDSASATFVQEASNLVAQSRREPRCFSFELLHDRTQATRFAFFEVFADDAAFQQHRDAAYTVHFKSLLPSLVSGIAEESVVYTTRAFPAPSSTGGGAFALVVNMETQPARTDEFIAEIQNNAAATRGEPGCRSFEVLREIARPTHFVLYEIYENEAAMQAHRETAHFKRYAGA